VFGYHYEYALFNCTVCNCTFLPDCGQAIRETYGSHQVRNSLVLSTSASQQGGDFVNCVFGSNTSTNTGKYAACVKATTADQVALDPGTYMPVKGTLPIDAANSTYLPAAYGDYDFSGTNRVIGTGLDVGASEFDQAEKCTISAEAIDGVAYEGVSVGVSRKAVPFSFTVRRIGVPARPIYGIETNGVVVAFGDDGSATVSVTKPDDEIAVTKMTDSSAVWYVDEKLGTDDDPLGWKPGADAYKTLQAAMENPNLLAGDTVSAAEGTYSNGYYRIEATTKAPICDSRVRIPDGVKLVASGRRSETVILGKAGTSDGGLGEGCVRCAIVGANAVLQGFTLKNGYAARNAATDTYYHGGAASVGSGGIVVDCDVLNCKAQRGGAGNGGRWIRCYFDGNTCGQIGAGFYSTGATLYNCVIKSTSGSYFGCDTAFYYCTFLDGTVQVMRGFSGCIAKNCLIQSGKVYGYPYRCAFSDKVTNVENANNCITTNMAGVAVESSTYEPISGTAVIDAADESLVTFPAGYGETDFNGKPRKVGATMDIGAVEWQGYGLTVAEPPAGVTFEGVAVGKNPYNGEPITFKVKRAVAGGRLVSRVVLDGKSYYFGDADELELTAADTTRDVSMTIPGETIFYVDDKLGDDANDGVRPGAGALKTLQAASEKTIAYDTVYVAEGFYDDNTKQVAASGRSPAYGVRVSIKANVSFIATGRRSETLIVGQRGTATEFGDDAIRCVNLGSGALLQGFTVTNGYAVVGTQDYLMGGGVSASGDGYIVDCDIVKCRAHRAGAGEGGTWIRCYFNDNQCAQLCSGIRSANKLYNCVIGKHSGYFCWDGAFYNCTFLSTCEMAFRNTQSYPDGNLFNCLILSNYANDQGGVFSNCVFGVGTKIVNSHCATGNCLRATSAAEVAYDPVTFEPRKGTLMMEAADASLVKFPAGYGETDFRGCPRVLNGAMDVGASEYDWRKDFSAALAKRYVDVTYAGTDVTLVDDVVTIPAGDALTFRVALEKQGGTVTFRTGGAGTPKVVCETATVTGQDGVWSFAGQKGESYDVTVTATEDAVTVSAVNVPKRGLVVILK